MLHQTPMNAERHDLPGYTRTEAPRFFSPQQTPGGAPMSEEAARDRLVDLQVGQRIRQRRKEIRISQEALAECLGITFQQVQKYERGTNRVSASKLFAIAQALEVPISYFFEGLESLSSAETPVEDLSLLQRMLSVTGGLDLAKSFLRIRDDRVRRSLVSLVESMSARR